MGSKYQWHLENITHFWITLWNPISLIYDKPALFYNYVENGWKVLGWKTLGELPKIKRLWVNIRNDFTVYFIEYKNKIQLNISFCKLLCQILDKPNVKDLTNIWFRVLNYKDLTWFLFHSILLVLFMHQSKPISELLIPLCFYRFVKILFKELAFDSYKMFGPRIYLKT